VAQTELLYLTDSYLKSFSARVVDAEDHSVVLDRTAFYPRGGGQMSDRGTLRLERRTFPVIAVEKRGDSVHHTVDGRLPEAGAQVTGEIDWDFRYHMMRTHSALHVLCGVIYHRYGAHVTGCQMYPERARMDFTLEDLSAARIKKIEKLREKFNKDHPGSFLDFPFSYLSLSPRWLSGGRKSKHPVMFWLNPLRDGEANYYTVEELEQWLKGKGPVLKKKQKAT